MNRRSDQAAAVLLDSLTPAQLTRLVAAMGEVHRRCRWPGSGSSGWTPRAPPAAGVSRSTTTSWTGGSKPASIRPPAWRPTIVTSCRRAARSWWRQWMVSRWPVER